MKPRKDAWSARYAYWILVAVPAVLVIGISIYAVWTCQPDAGQDSSVPFSRIEHPPLPAYVPEQFLTEVQTLGPYPDVLDAREPDLLKKLHAGFAQHPWVEEVERVVQVSPRHIRVQLRFRQPAAAVVAGKDRHLVDKNGVRLPHPANGTSLSGLLEITGRINGPSGSPGKPWGDAAIEAAAGLAEILRYDRANLEITSIDVGADPLQPDLRLRTRKGSEIVWTQLTDRAKTNDALAEQKLQLLRSYREQHGALDRPNGPYVLDVRDPSAGIIRRQRSAHP